MRILFVTTKSPYPLHDGRALRTYNLMRELAREHEVHLASFVQTPEEVTGIEHMRTLCPVVVAHRLHFRARWAAVALDALREPFGTAPLVIVKYGSRAMRATLAALMREHRYDIVHLDMLHLAQYADLCGSVPTVLMEHNVESLILQRRAANERRPLARSYLKYQYERLQRFEQAACRRVGRVVAVSDADAELLAQLSGRTDIRCVPNGVDASYFRADAAPVRPGTLVFVGTFTWFPNEDAMRYFVDSVWPLIEAEWPGVTLTVIGESPDGTTRRHITSHRGVRCVGRVEDIRPYVAEAAAYIVPLRIGGGTRLKILDALAMSKAVVSTSIGCEGLAVTHGRDILIADTPADFAQQVLRVLRDPALAASLGQAGRRFVEERHDWRSLARGLAGVYRELTDGAGKEAGVSAQEPAAGVRC